MNLKTGNEVEVLIDTLAFGGEGVGRIQIDEKAFTVFVEDVAPGDRVLAQITQRKRNFARGFVKKILEPSALRIEPRCRHFGTSFTADGQPDLGKNCGGCTLQFVNYDQQLRFKEQQVRDAILRIGGVKDDLVLPIIGPADPWFYRNKMEFSFQVDSRAETYAHGHAAMRTKFELGLHLRGRHYDVTRLEECFLMAPYVGELVSSASKFFQKLLIEGTLPDMDSQKNSGFKLCSLTIREGKNTGERMLILTAENFAMEKWPDSAGGLLGEISCDFLRDFQKWACDFFAGKKLALDSLYFINVRNQTGRPKTSTEHLLYGKPTILEELRAGTDAGARGQAHEHTPTRKLQFQISPTAFFQPNTRQAEILYAKALEAAALTGTEIVYDLFCGTGTIGIFCARNAHRVYGIELNASAIENARVNAALNSISNIEFLVGDVGKHLPKIADKPDVIIVDPPRGGLEPKVVEKTMTLNPRRIVYVSCNPATLARDIKLFGKNFRLISVQPVDMFPQTYHIENVALLIAN